MSALLPSHSKSEEPAPKNGPAEAPAAAAATALAPLPEHFEEFLTVELQQIEPGESQPREAFDVEKLEELAQSIRAHGVLQPITVYRLSPNRFRLIAGERRWRAAERAGLKEIPALVRTVNPDELLELALIENIQREDLNPIEIAAAFYQLSSHHKLSHEQIAQKTGKDRTTVTNFIRLLRLSPEVRTALVSGDITMGHARALLNIHDGEEQAKICRDIKNRQLSVRDTESLVRQRTQPPGDVRQANEAKPANKVVDPNIRAAIEKLEMTLGTRVRLIARSEKSGKIEIEYYSAEDLERIYAAIVGEE